MSTVRVMVGSQTPYRVTLRRDRTAPPTDVPAFHRLTLRNGQRPVGKGLGLSLCVLVLATASGCASGRYLQNRSLRDNALTQSLQLARWRGPTISQRAQSTLRRYGLTESFEDDSEVCIHQLRSINGQQPDPDLAYTLSELSYVEGKKADREGRTRDAMNHYGVALTTSYRYLFGDQLQQVRNAYDPQFRATCDLYNESLEDLLRILCSEHRLRPGQTYTIQTADQKFVVRTEMRGGWKPDEFDSYEFVSDFDIKKLRNRHTTYGLGVPLIAIRRPRGPDDPREAYYPDGLSYAVTAMLRCSTSPEPHSPVPASENVSLFSNASHRSDVSTDRLLTAQRLRTVSQLQPMAGSSHSSVARVDETPTCILEFFDPLRANQIQLAGNWVPLETDLTTPLAYFLDSPEYRERDQATEGLLDPDDAQQKRGVYMIEPYDPNRIPVLMVHGLWSSPLTWMDMFNDLRSFPEIRERYQFWFYLYPSGQPFWISATQLRNDLYAMRQTFDPAAKDPAIDNMVLVGHSMGGLVSRMQTIDSGDDFWNLVSDKPREKLQGPPEDVIKLVSALDFRPNRSVSRVVTIGTPHQGSELANGATRWAAGKLIKLPRMAVSTSNRLIRANPDFFRDTRLLTEANAVDSLAPDSPIFPVMLRAKKSPDVRYHNIVGVLEKPPLVVGPKHRGDGVVEYKSATMNDTESELIVDAGHTTLHMTGKAIFEVRRILLKHLSEVDSRDRVAGARQLREPLQVEEVGFLEASVTQSAYRVAGGVSTDRDSTPTR